MKDYLHKTLFFSTIAVMVVFLVQTVTGFVRLEPLHGATIETEKPKLTLKNYTAGSFQNESENYLREHFGFREWLIRGYNQFLWSCFRETNNATVVRGKKDWLFEEVYVRDHYESLMYQYDKDTAEMRKILETEALRLWKVQELLKEYDIHLFVTMTPGKDVIYPEYLPRNRSYRHPDGLHAYDYYKKRFDELGINHIDYVADFQDIKNSVDYPLFPKTGTHWSNIASVYVFDSILRYMEHLGNQKFHHLEIGNKYQAKPRKPDTDLEDLLNLVFPIKSPPHWYADVTVKEDTSAVKPYLLTVGDSFFWNFVTNIPFQDLFQKNPFWYYNSSVFGDEAHTTTLDMDLDQELMRADYIMLSYGTTQLYELGSYFLPKALLHLCYDKATIDSAANQLIQTLKADSEFCAEVRNVAKNRKISTEQVMYEDAIYMISMNPEEYFEELRGARMPDSRNKDLPRIRKNTIFARSK